MSFRTPGIPLKPGTIRPRRLLLALVAVAFVAAACVQEGTAYPIEIFTEMHYSKAFRSQEAPRLSGVQSAVAYDGTGNAQDVVNILPANEAHEYDAVAGAELYRVNCSACHGMDGLGDGPAAGHITSPNSAWAEDNGTPYNAPPNLIQSRTRLTPEGVFGIVTNGIVVMPRFGPLLSEEARWDIVRYIFDTSPTGLGQ